MATGFRDSIAWNCCRAAIIVAVFGGCGSDKLAEKEQKKVLTQVEAVQSSAIVLKTDRPGMLCTVQGAVRDDGKGGMIWKAPGRGRFGVEIPYEQPVKEKSLWTSLSFINPKGQLVGVGDAKPELAVQEGGKLKLVVKHAVLANFETNGNMQLRIYYTDDGVSHTIADIPFHGKFE